MKLHELIGGVPSHSNLTSLDEIDRKNLVGKVKAQSPDRYNRRLSYHPSSYIEIDLEQLLTKDSLVAKLPVGDYTCTVAYAGVLSQLSDVLKKQPRPNVTLQSVIRAITQSIDKTDILVDCTCADFVYRYAYWATKYGYKYGKPETRPTKITNPDDESFKSKSLTTNSSTFNLERFSITIVLTNELIHEGIESRLVKHILRQSSSSSLLNSSGSRSD